jgi:hypothetical protein
MVDILDTQIANERYSNRRVNRFKIKTPLSSTDISRKQPRGYSMEKIGELERRIADLEYYTSLSFTEDTVKNSTITSSNDPNLERFKFGYFVDNFSTTGFSDLDNPEFNATIFNYELGPKKKQLNLEFKFDPADNTASLVTGGIATLPYSEYSLVQQLLVTDGAVIAPTATTVTVANVIAVSTTVTTVCVAITDKNQQYNTNGNTTEVTSFVFAANSGLATISFDVFGGVDRIEVYQNTTPSFSYSGTTPITTSENSVTLSASERTSLTANNALSNKWTVGARPDRTFATKGSNTKYWIKDAGKLSWTHDPAKGLYYKIVVVKGSPHHSYYICYPTNGSVTVSTATSTSTPAPTPTNFTATVVPLVLPWGTPQGWLQFKPQVAVAPSLNLAAAQKAGLQAPKPTANTGKSKNPR